MKRKKPTGRKRPFKTLYYTTVNAKDDAWAAQGHSSTELGAIKGSTWRIVVGTELEKLAGITGYVLARLYDEKEVLIHTFRNTPQGLTHNYGRAGGPSRHYGTGKLWRVK